MQFLNYDILFQNAIDFITKCDKSLLKNASTLFNRRQLLQNELVQYITSNILLVISKWKANNVGSTPLTSFLKAYYAIVCFKISKFV